jgi:hypothetical protein
LDAPAGFFTVLFICVIIIGSAIWGGITYSHRDDPDELAQRTQVTLQQMGVTDASKAGLVVRKDGEAYVTFHINTRNNSDRKYKITWCGPRHAYDTEASRTDHAEEARIELCTAYTVKAHSTKQFTATKRDVFGYDGGSIRILGKGGIALIETCRFTCLWGVEAHPVVPRVDRPYEG